jgi:hypothetical protein
MNSPTKWGLVWWSGAVRSAMEEKEEGQGGADCHRLGPPASRREAHLPAAHDPRRPGRGRGRDGRAI